MDEDRKLTKKERKQQAREERQMQQLEQAQSSIKQKWFIIGAVVIGVVALVGIVLFKANEPAKPLPGTAEKVLGRDHVNDIAGVTYSSNPPTSGTHFPLWAKRGVYPKIFSDGYQIHSLEHGYIVMSYNCGPLAKPQSSLTYKGGDPLTTMPGDANQVMEPFFPQSMPKEAIDPPASFQSASCKQLVNNLATFLNDFQRIVIVPRTNLDAPIVFTAWGRLEKFQSFDKDKMTEFIQAYHGAGPEQTVE